MSIEIMPRPVKIAFSAKQEILIFIQWLFSVLYRGTFFRSSCFDACAAWGMGISMFLYERRI